MTLNILEPLEIYKHHKKRSYSQLNDQIPLKINFNSIMTVIYVTTPYFKISNLSKNLLNVENRSVDIGHSK